MRMKVASTHHQRAMRTTLDIEPPILDELREFGRIERRSLGQVASQLLAEAIDVRKAHLKPVGKFVWNSRPMGARVDISDKDAVFSILDQK